MPAIDRSGLPIFVINLARSVERRRGIERQLGALGLEPRFMPACDGATLPEQDAALAGAFAVQPHLRRALTRGEVGCLLSHSAVYERIVRDALPLACVLEDDCRLGADFARVLQAIDTRRRPEWDLVLLGHHSSRCDVKTGAEICHRSTAIGAGYRIGRVAEFPLGAYAYVITAGAAQALLAYARPFRMPADWVTGYSPAAGVRLHAVKPPCVQPDAVLAADTTLPDRHVTLAPPTGARGGMARAAATVRARAGTVLLRARKLGLRPGSYVKRF